MKANESLQTLSSSSLLCAALIFTSMITSGRVKAMTISSNLALSFPEHEGFHNFEMGFSDLNQESLDMNSQVQGCKIYDDNANCLYCIRDQYLSGGVCTSLEYSKLIQNCNVYSSATECFECDQDYKSSTDKKSCNLVGTVNGCRKWRDSNTCIVCASGFLLQNGNCSPSIANCVIPLNSTTCLECASGFGILDDTLVCKPVTSGQAVEKCARYTNNVCTQCLSGYALDLVNTKCLKITEVDNQIDENCVNTIVSNDQYCNICRQGFYLDVKADGSLFCNTLNAKDESCYIIDFIVRQNCLVCMPNFEMKNKKCIASLRDQPAITDPVGSSLILNSIMVLTIGIFVLN